MKNTDKNTVQNAWNAFEISGRVEDYLRYAKTNIRAEVKRQVQTQTEGLIIKSRDINENDTVVKILTGDLGLISAFANGTKKVKSRTASAAVSPMTYSRLTLYCGRESYIVDDAKAIDVFSGCARTLKNYRLQIIFASLRASFRPRTPRLTNS